MGLNRNPSDVRVPAGPSSELVQQAIADWSPERSFDARDLLNDHPSFAHDRSALLTLALEEFFRLQERGAVPVADAFVERFPEIRSTLRWHLSMHSQICADPEALAEFLAAEWPVIGDVIGEWELQQELGAGGFSRVYLAMERNVARRPVVLKITRSPREEAAYVGLLDHPGIMRVLSVKQLHDKTAIAMPYLGVATLLDVIDFAFPRANSEPASDAFLAGVRLSQTAIGDARYSSLTQPLEYGADHVENVVRVAVRLCQALHDAHQQGVYHCDIKPSNVLLASTGAPVLLDFNLAVGGDLDSLALGGTLPYMAPEHLDLLAGDPGARPLDGRADIYSLGVTMYQLLTGRLPFEEALAEGDRQLAAQQMRTAHNFGPHPLRQHAAAVPESLARLIEDCLAVDRNRRPATALELEQRLSDALSPPAEPRDETIEPANVVQPQPAVNRHSRRRRLYIAGAAAGASALVLLAILTIGKPSAARNPSPPVNATDAGQPAVEQPPTFAAALALLDSGKPEAARAMLEQLPERDSPLVQAHRAELYSREGSWPDAIALYESARASGFDSAALRNNLGWCQFEERAFSEALGSLQSARDLDPEALQPLVNLAYAESNVPARNEVMPDFTVIELALQRAPDDAWTHSVAARVYARGLKLSEILDPATGAVLQEKCLAQARLAVELGADSQFIREILANCSQLEDDLRDTLAAASGRRHDPKWRPQFMPLPRTPIDSAASQSRDLEAPASTVVIGRSR